MIGTCSTAFGLLGFEALGFFFILVPDTGASDRRLVSDFLLLLAVSAGAAGVGTAASSARAFLIDLFIRVLRCVRSAAALGPAHDLPRRAGVLLRLSTYPYTTLQRRCQWYRRGLCPTHKGTT